MNKVAVVSDLHLDHWSKYVNLITDGVLHKHPPANVIFKHLMEHWAPLLEDVDCLFMAGDYNNGHSTHCYIDRNFDTDVVYVPGNHDFYGHVFPTIANTVVGADYIGMTLWSNFGNAPDADIILRGIYDYKAITHCTPEMMKGVFNKSIRYIEDFKREIVVTHFPPHQNSVAEKYKGNYFNPYFVNNLQEEDFKRFETKLWICGHTHWKHSYTVGDTLVVANPLGYPWEVYRDIYEYTPTIVEKVAGKWTILE